MTLAFWMVLVAALLPYLTVGLAKFAGPGYDNRAPRAYLEGLAGWRARADWAHRNHFEAFPPFAAGVLVAHWAQGETSGLIDGLAVAFILARVGYTGAYIADWALVRSLLWFCGLGCVVALFFAGWH